MLKFCRLGCFFPLLNVVYIWCGALFFGFWILNLNLYDSGVKSAYQVRAAWKKIYRFNFIWMFFHGAPIFATELRYSNLSSSETYCPNFTICRLVSESQNLLILNWWTLKTESKKQALRKEFWTLIQCRNIQHQWLYTLFPSESGGTGSITCVCNFTI